MTFVRTRREPACLFTWRAEWPPFCLSPGPDYKLYLSPEFVETEADFKRLKPTMVRVGDVKTFKNFLVTVPEAVDPARYNTVIVWCETFSQFITAAKYR
jgi:hypothetical protein